MDLKKFILMVFMYMMEHEENELTSTVGKLSFGGLIYIAKLCGMNDIEKLMKDLISAQKKVDKLSADGECDEAACSEVSEILQKIFELVDDESIVTTTKQSAWLLTLCIPSEVYSECFTTLFSTKEKLIKYIETNAPIWDANICLRADKLTTNDGILTKFLELNVESDEDDGWFETPYDLLERLEGKI